MTSEEFDREADKLERWWKVVLALYVVSTGVSAVGIVLRVIGWGCHK